MNQIKKINYIIKIGENEEKNIKHKRKEILEYEGIIKRESEKYNDYPFEELQNVAFENETPKELKEILYNIIFSRIIKQ